MENLTLFELKESLEKYFNQNGTNIDLDLKHSDVHLKGIDPTVLNASIGLGGAVLGALITGLLGILNSKHGQTIEIESKSGAKIKMPANASSEQIDLLIAKIKELDKDEWKLMLVI